MNKWVILLLLLLAPGTGFTIVSEGPNRSPHLTTNEILQLSLTEAKSALTNLMGTNHPSTKYLMSHQDLLDEVSLEEFLRDSLPLEDTLETVAQPHIYLCLLAIVYGAGSIDSGPNAPPGRPGIQTNPPALSSRLKNGGGSGGKGGKGCTTLVISFFEKSSPKLSLETDTSRSSETRFL